MFLSTHPIQSDNIMIINRFSASSIKKSKMFFLETAGFELTTSCAAIQFHNH